METKQKNSGLDKIVKGVAIGSIILGGIIYGASTDRIETMTNTYQGHFMEQGKKTLVFDNQSKAYRIGPADLTIHGNPQDLKIGQEYMVKYKIPHCESLFPKKLEAIN